MSPEQPLMENIAELVEYIKREDPSVGQICQFAVVRTFNFLHSSAMFAASLDAEGLIKPIGQFGYSSEVMKSWESSSIDEDIPTADALKTNNIVWLADREAWNRDYPHLAQYLLHDKAVTFVAWPISVRGAYMSVLGINLDIEIAPTPSLVSYFETIGGIIAMHLSQSNLVSTTPEQDHIVANFNLFTRRQRDVMRLVADGLTNSQIGAELGFSESTIRQETMRIYEILGASGRGDAIRMYRSVSVKV